MEEKGRREEEGERWEGGERWREVGGGGRAVGGRREVEQPQERISRSRGRSWQPKITNCNKIVSIDGYS